MIIRVKKNKSYTVMSNHGLNNPELSLKAKGLYAYLLSRPDDWNISERGLASQMKEGRDAIGGAMKELETAKYLVRSKHRAANGQYINQCTLYETPGDWEQSGGNTVAGKSSQADDAPADPKNLAGKTGHGKPSRLLSTDQTSTTTTDVVEAEPQEFGDPTINQMIAIFEEANGSKLRLMTKQRRAAQHIIRRFGNDADKAIGACNAAIACRDQQYAPAISNLLDLHEKLDKLALFYRKTNNAKVVAGVVQ